ncbi:hypothetical protein [Arenimonas sp.]|uniref:hypothetical protein n=1 Tax=Arenimonas sp. TaxID=1872635 RepID=UPI0039E3571A
MNTIAIQIEESQDAMEVPYRAVRISVDGNDFLEMLRAHEMPYAQREGHSNIAGGYAWPYASTSTRDAFLGIDADENNRVELLACQCGSPGCWPLLVQIDVGPSEVVWSSFEQPHRGEDSAAGHWHYNEFGPFVFERSQYEAAVAGIA